MADYIYLLETRLSKNQQAALIAVRRIAREHELTVFLVGGAIRDLISGAPVRDLDVAVQGNALKLKKDLEKAGAEISSEVPTMQALHVRFPSGVRLEVGSTLTTSYPKPGRAVVKPATILDDLRRRDFTANAMALSLNEGSYGLLMDPLNGVADIEDRQLRLVSNYGFIEDPVRLIRAARFMARLGWRLEEKTETRYGTAKDEDYIAAMQPAERGYELEELFHEEDPLRVMRRLEEEGWLEHLAPSLSVEKANAAELGRLRDLQLQLQEQGVLADASAANFPLLTAKMSLKETVALRESFPRRIFVHEIDTLDAVSKDFAAQLSAKQAAMPSQAYALITRAPAVVVLWTAYTTKSATLQAKFKSFLSEWPQARQRIPYLLMQEMRITPDLERYEELLHNLSMELMDGTLDSPEAMRAFLEPYSPPAPPPPVSLRRPRVAKGNKKETRSTKARKKPDDIVPVSLNDDDPAKAASVVADESLSHLDGRLAAVVSDDHNASPNGTGRSTSTKLASRKPAPAKKEIADKPEESKPRVSPIKKASGKSKKNGISSKRSAAPSRKAATGKTVSAKSKKNVAKAPPTKAVRTAKEISRSTAGKSRPSGKGRIASAKPARGGKPKPSLKKTPAKSVAKKSVVKKVAKQIQSRAGKAAKSSVGTRKAEPRSTKGSGKRR